MFKNVKNRKEIKIIGFHKGREREREREYLFQFKKHIRIFILISIFHL